MNMYMKLNRDAVSFPLKTETVWIPLCMNIERYRLKEGHNLYPFDCQLAAGRLSHKNHELFFDSKLQNQEYVIFSSEIKKKNTFLVHLIFF